MEIKISSSALASTARDPAIRALRALIRQKDPTMLFLMDTKISSSILASTAQRLGFQHFIFVPSIGTKGGLALLWHPNVDIGVVYVSEFLISYMVTLEDGSPSYSLFCEYGPVLWRDKVDFWRLLLEMTDSILVQWIVVGDLNAIVAPHEKQGGCIFHPSSSAGLFAFLDASGAIDIVYVGSPFTWDNGRPGLAHIKERLDRCLVSIDWRLLYPNATLSHHLFYVSDHSTITLRLWGPNASLPRQFKFEEFWLSNHFCFSTVKLAWHGHFSGPPVVILAQKIRAIKMALKR